MHARPNRLTRGNGALEKMRTYPRHVLYFASILQYWSNCFSSCIDGVTAACLYPALMLDKFYAALIRCLVLWTVKKQILVFLF